MKLTSAALLVGPVVIAIAPVLWAFAESSDVKEKKSSIGASAMAVAPAKPAEKLPPLKGSHVADDSNACLLCHTTADQWDPKDKQQYRFYLSLDALKKDVHYQKGVSCTDCHGGNSDDAEVRHAHSADDFRTKQADIIAARCAHCHESEMTALRSNSVHTKADTSDPANPTVLSCDACHGKLAHSLLPLYVQAKNSKLLVKNQDSPVQLANQVDKCGHCHDKEKGTFLASVHGKGLTKMGLDNVAVCADCHGAHAIYHAVDDRSTLNIARVAETCGKCHQGIPEKLLASVHGRGGVLGGKSDRHAPGGKSKQLPSCTSCHQGHDLPSPESIAFREMLPDRCGNCHREMSGLYGLSIHGKLTDLGYGPAAKCADCHGAHDILALDNPQSKLSAENRLQTCGNCHPGARANFVAFNPHLDPYDGKKNPAVHAVQITLLVILFSTFIFFGIHSILWFIRGLVEVLGHGRPPGLRPGATAYVRFISFHRIGHTIMMTSFLGLALTGLPLKYHDAWWAKPLALGLGGFASTSFWHRFFGVILLVSMAAYLARMVRLLIQAREKGRTLGAIVFGPDSPVPNMRDLKDFLKMVRWFFGLGPKPGLDRWSYWEKIDFWGAIADTVIIGMTGLVLWFPNLFCRVLPGTALNIAQVIHSTQALLATGFVFAIHFFNTHFRPDKFPADMSVLTGLVSEEEFKEERPDYFNRLQRDGKLEAMRTTSPGLFVLLSIRVFGFIALAIGLALLVAMIVAAIG